MNPRDKRIQGGRTGNSSGTKGNMVTTSLELWRDGSRNKLQRLYLKLQIREM